jgi:hypothetical protein
MSGKLGIVLWLSIVIILISGPLWAADSDNTWNIPLGSGVGRLVRFDKLPMDFKLTAYSNVEKPDGGADWTLLLQVKLLFPK